MWLIKLKLLKVIRASTTVRATREPMRANRTGPAAKAFLDESSHPGVPRTLYFLLLRSAYFGGAIV